MTVHVAAARLLLGDRPRVEIPLTSAGPGALPTWLTVALPGPTSESRPEGRFLADPRLPESAVVLTWGTAPGVPRASATLTVCVGEKSWTLEQDARNPRRWLEQAHSDHGRCWS